MKHLVVFTLLLKFLGLFSVVALGAEPSQADLLVDAVTRGDTSKVKSLIEAKADPNGSITSGATPLYRAAATGNLELARLLLDAGANPNGGGDQGSPLLAAIANQKSESGHAAMVELLLARGAAPKAAGQSGITPLLAAVWKQDTGLVQRLLGLGAEVNRPDASGETPLFHAALKNNLPLVRILLEAGGDVNQPGPFGSTPIFMAAEHGTLELVKLLLDKGARLDVTNDMGLSPLASSVALLGMREPEIPSPRGTSPQSSEESARIIAFLLDKGLDPNLRGKEGITGPLEGMTPLMHAVMANNGPIIRLLHTKGARLTDTLLAPKTVQPNGFERLLEGATPLMLAALMEKEEALRTLLELGADPSQRAERSRFTAMMLAMVRGREDLAGILGQKGGVLSPEDQALAKRATVEILRSLMEEDLSSALAIATEASQGPSGKRALSTDDLGKAGWRPQEKTVFVSASCDQATCRIVLRQPGLATAGVKPPDGLVPGEGSISGGSGQRETRLPTLELSQAILGRWREPGAKATLDFHPDGAFTASDNQGMTVQGRFSVGEDGSSLFDIALSDGKIDKRTGKVGIKGRTLTMFMEGEKGEERYERDAAF